MKKNLEQYTVNENSSIIMALERIDSNCAGFLVVIDNDERVLGVISDGDIRRGVIKGASNEDPISDIYTKNAKIVKITDGIESVAEIFKNQAIRFLPIVDDEGRLKNIITKNQLHTLLLLDLHADLEYEFDSLDTSVIDYEVFFRPWGFYKTTVLNDYYQAKVISVKPSEKLSLQSHEHREEHWIIVHGEGVVQVDDSLFDVTCGSSLFIPKGAKHRATNSSSTESLIIAEVQIGDYLGEDDIIRYEDIYGRA